MPRLSPRRPRARRVGLRSRRGPARDAARPADAREVGEGHPGPREARRAQLRAQVGRVPVRRLQGRRRGGAGQPQHQAADPLLPRGRRRDARAAAASAACSTGRSSSPSGDRLEFEVLQERIHPAASRIAMLAEKTPASYVAFDLLALGDDVVRRPPVRRAARGAGGGARRARRPLLPDPHDDGPGQAEEWFHQFEGAGLDGVVAKPLTAPYQQNARTMLKIKHERTADVVVAGYREHKTSTPEKPLLGSLLLGLYNATGKLQHIGVSASFTAARRAELIEELQPLVCDISEHPWGEWQEWADRQPGPRARHPEPVERGQGPVVHAAATRAGAGGGLRPHGGPAVPAHRAVPALAHRPRPGVVRLRAVGRARQLRPR